MDPADGHRYFEGLAVAHVLGGLDDSEGRVFRAHLLECGNCRARVGELRAIAHDLADVERDERRVRAAQAIDTKRRESEDETDEQAEPLPSARSSRITVIVGLVLIIGLSLWNFTLRGALTVQESVNRDLVAAAVIGESGVAWTPTRQATGVEAVVKQDEERMLVSVDGLDPEQWFGLYLLDDAGGVITSYGFRPSDGRFYRLFDREADAATIVVTNPVDENGEVAEPNDRELTGVRVFEADAPEPEPAPLS